jgi:O-antigen ligase
LIPSLIAVLEGRLLEEYFWSTTIQYFIVLSIFLLINNAGLGFSEIKKCLWIYCIGAALNGILMNYQFMYLDLGRQSGLTDNPNTAAFSCCIAFTFFLYQFFRSTYSLSFKILFAVLSAILMLSLFVTGSRTAFIAMAILIPFIAFYRIPFQQKLRNGLVLIAGISLIFWFMIEKEVVQVLPVLDRMTKLDSREDSRIALWGQGFEAFRESGYMGLGIEQFKNPEVYSRYIKKSDNPSVINQKGLVVHNTFLTVLFEYGLLSFLLFVSFYYVLMKRLINRAFFIQDPVLYLALFFNILWFSFFLSVFQSHAIWFIYIILSLVIHLKIKSTEITFQSAYENI